MTPEDAVNALNFLLKKAELYQHLASDLHKRDEVIRDLQNRLHIAAKHLEANSAADRKMVREIAKLIVSIDDHGEPNENFDAVMEDLQAFVNDAENDRRRLHAVTQERDHAVARLVAVTETLRAANLGALASPAKE